VNGDNDEIWNMKMRLNDLARIESEAFETGIFRSPDGLEFAP
jgi:hypothetical protein